MLYNELLNSTDKNQHLIIEKNPDSTEFERISASVKANDGYCPCLLTRSSDTKCPCKPFRDSDQAGFCHCERYYKLPRPEIVCLCGSTRFKDDFIRVQEELTLAGFIVLSVGVFGYDRDIDIVTKQHLDNLHKIKIAHSDCIVVINKDNYIGESTRSEIQFATILNKPIFYLEEHG